MPGRLGKWLQITFSKSTRASWENMHDQSGRDSSVQRWCDAAHQILGKRFLRQKVVRRHFALVLPNRCFLFVHNLSSDFICRTYIRIRMALPRRAFHAQRNMVFSSVDMFTIPAQRIATHGCGRRISVTHCHTPVAMVGNSLRTNCRIIHNDRAHTIYIQR